MCLLTDEEISKEVQDIFSEDGMLVRDPTEIEKNERIDSLTQNGYPLEVIEQLYPSCV